MRVDEQRLPNLGLGGGEAEAGEQASPREGLPLHTLKALGFTAGCSFMWEKQDS